MEGVKIPDCVGKFCYVLPEPVYPTPLYEVIITFILFLILWNLRHKVKVPGMLFGIYLMLNGLERFCIELIRVNSKYNAGGIAFTQAELIALILFISGLVMVLYTFKNRDKLAKY